jgi:hypothetical protein
VSLACHHRSSASGIALCAVLIALGGCPSESSTDVKEPKQSVRVRSFTEATPVRLLLTAAPYAFSVSGNGLDRWDLETGGSLELNSEHGLPGDRVEALALDAGRGWMWVATNGGITRYTVQSGTFSEIPKAPQVLGLEDFAGVSLSPSSDGGVWIGDETGLFYTNQSGQWTNTPITDAVTSLWRSREGWLWIGTEKGLISREPTGETYAYGIDDGCDLSAVRFIERAPDGGPLVVGTNAEGKQRIVVFIDGACATYRASPNIKWVGADAHDDELYVLTSRGLYALGMPSNGARKLDRNGMRLLAVPGEETTPPKSPFPIRAMDVTVPPGAEVIAAAGNELLIGTRDLGTARVKATKKTARTEWFRRAELVAGAMSMSAACAKKDDCYLATGSRSAWRFDGSGFAPTGDGDSRVLSFVRSPTEERIYVLHAGPEDSHISVSKVVAGVWTSVPGLEIETPGTRPTITFSRFSPGGTLWVGLGYTDDSGEEVAYGVAVIDIGLGVVVYHHASHDKTERAEGVLPIPINVVDASFIDDSEVWLATSQGAARVRGADVKLFHEGNGLRSELLRGVACSAGGMTFVASGQGVSTYDGESWTYPRELGWSVNDIEIADDGRLWMATDRGVAMFDGARVRRLDLRRGMLQNEIEDVALDHFGRVWARGSEGLTLITP